MLSLFDNGEIPNGLCEASCNQNGKSIRKGNRGWGEEMMNADTSIKIPKILCIVCACALVAIIAKWHLNEGPRTSDKHSFLSAIKITAMSLV